jgi:hypothetical protein
MGNRMRVVISVVLLAMFFSVIGVAAQPAVGLGPFECGDGTWTPTTLSGAPAARVAHTAVWTGTQMLVWGGLPVMSNNSIDASVRPDRTSQC